MSEDKKIVVLERIGQNKNIVKIRFTRNVNFQQSLKYMIAALSKCFELGYCRIVIDMGQIEATNNDLTATLIEATSKVRKKDGDIKLINLTEQAKQIMAGFSAYSYLSIEN